MNSNHNNDEGDIMRDCHQYTTKEIETAVDNYISQFKEGYFSPLALTARLTEDVGELAREINHTYGENPKKTTEASNTVEDEIGDILLVLACITNSLDLELSKSFHMSITKISTRDKDRWIKKDTEEQDAYDE